MILTESMSVSDAPPKDIVKTTDIRPALLRTDCSAVMNVIKLLRLIALNGFTSCQQPQKGSNVHVHECPIMELVLEAAPAGNSELVKTYQTAVILALMKHIQDGNEDVAITLKEIGPFSKSVIGLSVFCTRLVDKLWQGVYVKPSEFVYSFLKNLVEQALTKPKVLPLSDVQNALNRVILYQLSVVPETEPEQKDLVETLCLLSSHSHVIFDEMNTEDNFLQCLLYRLLSLVFTENVSNEVSIKSEGIESPPISPEVDQPSIGFDDPKPRSPSRHYKGYVPIMASSLLKSGANRLWSKMLEHKREPLEQILGIPLPVPASRTNIGNILYILYV